MRRTLVITVVLTIATVLGACSRDETDKTLAPKPFCEAVAKLDFDIGYVEPEAQVALVRTVAAKAPADIQDDAALFLEGMEKVVVNGVEITDEAERNRYEEAINRLQRYAIDHCGLLDQGGSSPFSGDS